MFFKIFCLPLKNQVCCEVVPKAGLDGDNLNWRLSFSQAEKILSEEVSERARMTYLAAKIILKKYLQFSCPILKSYHLKTIFFHYLEKKPADYWKANSIEKTITDFLGELLLTMEKKTCSHYFIKEHKNTLLNYLRDFFLLSQVKQVFR